MSVEIEAISGRKDAFTEEKTYTGHGVDPCTNTKDEMMVLSKLKVNASSPPASTAGNINGKVICVKRR